MMCNAAEIEAQAAEWLARRDRDDWSEQQQQAFDAWINAATAHRIAWLRLESIWQRADRLGSLHHPGRSAVPAAALFSQRYWRIAAGVTLVVGAAWIATIGLRDQPTQYKTALGQSTSLALDDGTRVTLNTNTRLWAKLASARRVVWLDKGEAYFEVTHDASRPFVVEAGSRRITVLGTRFSVRRDDDGQVQVTVADGRVQVSPTADGATAVPAIITRNDSLLAKGDAVLVSHETDQQTTSRLSWRQGRLVLDQMTLAQAAQEFNRYNKRQLLIADPVAAQLRIGGSFNVDNIDGFARLLEQGMGLKVARQGDIIKIYR
ncbi:FecR domain-containing protein [Duganella sp. sic0402]|uniref:FecR family protein n=1 Tax=Duganella sp. sic0402 TaxID=2854786 RepID=UPI001C441509|nr:FecR domain-containing protein [Duganella sp. sic0402]MBV7534696.1 FecR domain-containing protein [Duganella sp. sic0402]